MARFDHVEVVVPGGAQLGEGPVWDAERGLLAWVDIPARLVHLTDPRSGATRSIEGPLRLVLWVQGMAVRLRSSCPLEGVDCYCRLTAAAALAP